MNDSVPLALPLNRPQYFPASEVLLSSLVWGLGNWSYSSEQIHGSRFQRRGPSKPGIEETAPESTEDLAAFADALRSNGLQTDASDALLVASVINGVTGVTSQKSKAIPASPMTTHLALSQSLRGVLGVNNPPDIGGILESMFALGGPGRLASSRRSPMAAMWVQAATQRMQNDPLLAAGDAAMAQSLDLTTKADGGTSVDRSNHAVWSSHLRESPFGWLHDNWSKLTSPEWVDALPPRVWTDWCTTLLRMGMAFGYLFENQWFEAVGRSVLGENDAAPSQMLNFSRPLLLWSGARLPVSSRNVKPEIRKVVAKGALVRAQLQQHFGKGFNQVSLDRALTVARNDRNLKQGVRDAMSGRSWPGACKNMYETILYSLQQRDSSAEVDYYGLLRQRGQRYSVIQPGTEWIAVVASLACDEPGGETHVGKVLMSLDQLGLKPELMEIVKALESAGLAQGSADADHGVRVRSAY